LSRLPGPHLALRVDQPDSLNDCRSEGFRWIAGNYPLNLPPLKAVSGNPGRTVMLKLLGQISSDASSNDIEKTLKQDPQLSYQLLKLVNSVAFSLTTKISSFSQAITLLGRRQLQRWLQLLLYARPPGAGTDASPLMPRAAMRAGLMEGLSRATGGGKDDQDRAFMVGMFSLLESLVGLPAAEVVKSLNLAEEVTAALAAHQGPLGKLLAVVEAGECGPDAATAEALARTGIAPAVWAKEQAQACHWAVQVSREA
jgi:EAL and modified HD-GYP domain-containing signal transduction protein